MCDGKGLIKGFEIFGFGPSKPELWLGYNIPCMMMKMDDSVFYLIDLKYLRSYTIHELLS